MGRASTKGLVFLSGEIPHVARAELSANFPEIVVGNTWFQILTLVSMLFRKHQVQPRGTVVENARLLCAEN